jgi:Domain of unknown function (DUF305)
MTGALWRRFQSEDFAYGSSSKAEHQVIRNQQLALARWISLALIAGLSEASSAQAQSGLSEPSAGAPSMEAPFLAENAAAMDKMMAGMDVKPTGDADADFVAMMVPHHQGAIDMAQAVLRYGKNEQIRRIAQEIVVEQQQEIAAMRLAIGQPLPPSAPAPTAPVVVPAEASPVPVQDHSTMSHGGASAPPAMKMK